MATIWKYDGATRFWGVPERDMTEAELDAERPLVQRVVRTSGAWTLEGEDMTVAQLRERAKEFGITGASSLKKADLEAAVIEAEKAKANESSLQDANGDEETED